MSLVAYGSSDEGSDDNDMEDVTTRDLSTNPVTNKKSETKEDNKEALVRSYFKLEADNDTKSASGLKLPTPKSSPVKSSDISADQGPDMQRKKGKFSSLLPPPKNTAPSISAQADTSVPMSELPLGVEMDEIDEEILEIEDYTPLRKEKKTVKDTEDKPRSVGSMFSSLPPPWKSGATENRASKENVSRKSKQPVKIAVPSAPKVSYLHRFLEIYSHRERWGSFLCFFRHQRTLLPRFLHRQILVSDTGFWPNTHRRHKTHKACALCICCRQTHVRSKCKCKQLNTTSGCLSLQII